MSILHKIKNGRKNKKIVEFPGTDIKVALVILSSNDLTDAKLSADKYIEEKQLKDETYTDIILQQEILYRAMRDVDDIDKKVAGNIDDIRELQVNEIAFLMVQYNLFQQETSPFLSSVTEEQFEVLKKTFETMKWSDLSGESLLALRNFLLSLV
jgi:hypothetical protein